MRREVHAQPHADGAYHDLRLTPAEFRLMRYLVAHPRATHSREQLLEGVWGTRAEAISERAIDVHICQLRKKLPDAGPSRIDAVYGEGYRYLDGGHGNGDGSGA